MPHQNYLTELVAVIGAGDVRCFDTFLPFPADALDGLLPKTDGRLYSAAGKLHNVEETKTTSDDIAMSQCRLCCFLAFLLHVFHTSARAVVIVIQLVQRSEVTRVAQCESISVGNMILDANKLSSSVLGH